jgi:predicted RNA-binding protein with PUA-like domain
MQQIGYWLMKSEPDEFSITALEQKKTHHWDGVRNYEARNFMRDKMQVGDFIIFYHSSATPSGPAGVAKVASIPYPDFTQWDKHHKYYDPKASKEKPIWYMVDVRFMKRFPRTISREELKTIPELSDMQLWKHNRLSITPLTKTEFETIVQLGAEIK